MSIVLISVVVASGKEFISSKLTFFLVVDRMPENEIEDYFSYELPPYLMLLFKRWCNEKFNQRWVEEPFTERCVSFRTSTKYFQEYCWWRCNSGALQLCWNHTSACRPATLLKERLWHRCFPVNFTKLLRTPFLQNTSGWLLLNVVLPVM